MICGLVVGVYRMINEFAIPGPKCGDADPRPSFILGVHYLYFAILLAGITFIIAAAVSLLTPPINRRYLLRLTDTEPSEKVGYRTRVDVFVHLRSTQLFSAKF